MPYCTSLCLIGLVFILYLFLKKRFFMPENFQTDYILILASALLVVLLILLLFFRKNRVKKKTASRQKEEKESKAGLLTGIAAGMEKTRQALSERFDSLFQANPSEKTLDQLHETLYHSDMGVKTVNTIISHLRKNLSKEDFSDRELVKKCLSEKIFQLINIEPTEEKQKSESPHVLLVVGVNGAGKTTTIGKLTEKYKKEGKTVAVCAADTYRAAAIEQLQTWGKRLDVKVYAQKQGADPAAVAFDAVKASKNKGVDILIIDTAGRLQSKTDLMEELAKINRAIKKELPAAPHETLIVVDATMGQNAIQQMKVFKKFVDINGIIVTKLDGTAKGGVVVALIDQFKIPLRYLGVGESSSDLKEFNPKEYVKNLFL